jgi:hypothetical protein
VETFDLKDYKANKEDIGRLYKQWLTEMLGPPTQGHEKEFEAMIEAIVLYKVNSMPE